MVGFAVDRHVEFGRGQMEFGSRSWSLGKKLSRAPAWSPPSRASKEVSRDGETG
jgi:hypothetical protein